MAAPPAQHPYTLRLSASAAIRAAQRNVNLRHDGEAIRLLEFAAAELRKIPASQSSPLKPSR